MATAMKPKMVKNCPESNCSEVIGATTMPPIAPIIAASAKLKSVMRGTSMPISRAASGFSAQARSCLPSMVRDSRYHSATMTIAAVPAIQKPCVGTRTPRISTGASPENAGRS